MTTVDFYLNLRNYLNNWKRLGFTDDDIAKPGSDRLIDAVVAHGTAEDIAARLNEHLDAGADHVDDPGARRLGRADPDVGRTGGPPRAQELTAVASKQIDPIVCVSLTIYICI